MFDPNTVYDATTMPGGALQGFGTTEQTRKVVASIFRGEANSDLRAAQIRTVMSGDIFDFVWILTGVLVVYATVYRSSSLAAIPRLEGTPYADLIPLAREFERCGVLPNVSYDVSGLDVDTVRQVAIEMNLPGLTNVPPAEG